MGFYLVTLEQGPVWDYSRARREQTGWKEHAEFINELEDRQELVLAGPLYDGPRVLQVHRARNEAEIRSRLDPDPWVRANLLRIVFVEPWDLLVGTDRLGPRAPAAR